MIIEEVTAFDIQDYIKKRGQECDMLLIILNTLGTKLIIGVPNYFKSPEFIYDNKLLDIFIFIRISLSCLIKFVNRKIKGTQKPFTDRID